MIVSFLAVAPLGLWEEQENRTFKPLALKQGLELTALPIQQQQMNPARIPVRGSIQFFTLHRSRLAGGWGGSRYSHKDTREGKVLAQGHIASF